MVKFVTASRVKLLRSEVCAYGASEVFAFGKNYDMSAPDSLILQTVNLRVSAIITHNVPQALITKKTTP